MNTRTRNTKSHNATTRCYLSVSVILTFDTENQWGDSQEFQFLQIPVSSAERSAKEFLNKKLFKRVTAYCLRLSRDPNDLVKISTAANWAVFEAKTGKPSLPRLGHSCKWYFGCGRADNDSWEEALARDFGFGLAVDKSVKTYVDRIVPTIPSDQSQEGGFERSQVQ